MGIEKRYKVIDIVDASKESIDILISGWVRNKRQSKNVAFLSINDGSTIKNLQVVIDLTKIDIDLINKINTGTSVSIIGKIVKSQGRDQSFELNAHKVDVLGIADPESYPLQPKRHSFEFLRDIAHLRSRTNTFGAIFRIRHAIIYAIHNFFNSKGFLNIHTPILTSSDAEGAGEMFKVTTLDIEKKIKNNYNDDFFGKEVNLTVSGQLNAELAALGLSEVYTFGPTFRAENSNTSRHLAEFWMIEPEMAFYDIKDNMDLAEEMLKYLVKYTLDNCKDDLSFLEKAEEDRDKQKPMLERQSLNLTERLKFVCNNTFERLTYSEAFQILKSSKPNKKNKFDFPVNEWGIDFQSEHERYLVEKHFKKPVIIVDYPKNIKAFYMRQNDDDKTVAAMDVLFPIVGEIIGGSQREERYDKLFSRMREMNISEKQLWWYLETRKFGTVIHSGFGLGLERLVQFVTGMTNIRDVIPFPRSPGNCSF